MDAFCISDMADEADVDDWVWKYHTKFVKSFPSRQKDETIYFSESQIDKFLHDGIQSSIEKALSDGYSEDIVNCLISVDGKITDEMMTNFHKAFYKMLERYNELYHRKHYVICTDGEYDFSDPNNALIFIEQRLNDFRENSQI
jgi:hypothetical protein